MRLLPPFLTLLALSAAVVASSPAHAQAQSDIDESKAQLELGTHTLTGRPGASRYALAEAGKRKGLFSKGAKLERVFTNGQPVVLIPYTRLVEAITLKYRGDAFSVTSSLGELGNYTARV